MEFLLLSILAPLVCVIHIFRTGRNPLWLWAVILLPAIGCIAYLVVEILPDLMGSRGVREAGAVAVKTLDPQRELRAAKTALATTATGANRIRVGDALMALGRHGEAVSHYETASSGLTDARTTYKLALAVLEAGDPARALDLAATLPALDETDCERAELLRARALDRLGRSGEAIAVYAGIVDRVPGEAARCRYAELLIAAGRHDEARGVLQEVAQRARQLTRRQRAGQQARYDWAAGALAKLG